MTLREKILQISQGFTGTNDNPNNVMENFKNFPPEIGSLIYYSNTSELGNMLQKEAVEGTRLGIPILFGYVDSDGKAFFEGGSFVISAGGQTLNFEVY